MEKSIFVVDGNDTNLMLAERYLEDAYNVITLPTVQKMFSLLAKVTPGLILLDVDIQDMDCFDVLFYLKSDQIYLHIPIIITLGSRDTYIDTRSIELGAADLMIKPFSPNLLLNRVKIHMERASVRM